MLTKKKYINREDRVLSKSNFRNNQNYIFDYKNKFNIYDLVLLQEQEVKTTIYIFIFILFNLWIFWYIMNYLIAVLKINNPSLPIYWGLSFILYWIIMFFLYKKIAIIKYIKNYMIYKKKPLSFTTINGKYMEFTDKHWQFKGYNIQRTKNVRKEFIDKYFFVKKNDN